MKTLPKQAGGKRDFCNFQVGPDDNDKIKDECSCTPKQNQLVKSDPPSPPPPPPGPTFEDVAKQDPFMFCSLLVGLLFLQ
jgi:hypothetical protein